MRKNEYTITFYVGNKILCAAVHKKTKLSAWGTSHTDPEKNAEQAVERLEALVKEHKEKNK